MTSAEIRQKFLDFFEKRGHKIIPSTSLIPPEKDKSSLFVSAGVQPLATYVLGEAHPLGKRLANIQKCVRVQDIDEVGDKTHDTFFEMMGNWSLGDYFKEDAIKWSYELLTDKNEGMGLDPSRLYVTVFGGNNDAPRDTESFEIWKKYIPENRIYFLTWNGKKEPNWWDAGDNGPAGPDTEIFYDLTGKLGDMTKEEYLAADERQDVVEIWNNVFMEYEKKDGKVIGKLKNKNVDTGAGLERWAMALQGKDNIFDTDLFKDVVELIDENKKKIHGNFYENLVNNERRIRIVSDHLRTIIFLVSGGILPGKNGREYIVRKLMRRTMLDKGIEEIYPKAFAMFEKIYKKSYTELNAKRATEIYSEELLDYKKNLEEGTKEFNKKYRNRKGSFSPHDIVTGEEAFYFYSTFGIPKESFIDLFETNDLFTIFYKLSSDFNEEFEEEMKKHQEISKAGMEQKFKGGLGGHSEMEVKYHTATHLLHQALRDVLGSHVEQRGSNITPERLRFDFSHPQKMTEEEIKKVEDIVNKKIKVALPMNQITLPKKEAEKSGALHFFGDKYGDQVSIYYIGDSLPTAYSKEFCGGPHVERTSDLASERDPEEYSTRDGIKTRKTFKIQKEEAISAGIRRIKAVLE